MEQVLEELDSLCMDRLDEDWVQAIYHSEFLEIADFPPDYESAIENVNIKHVFQNIMKAVETWLDADYEAEEEKSWASLSPKVPHQRLLTVLAFYIDYGTKNVHTKEYRNNALLASRVYYTLLSIPGFKAYDIYHAQLFCQSLACLGFPKEMCDKDDNFYNTKELTREVNSLIRELRPYVLDLRSVVEKLQLKQTDMNFEDILSQLVDITGGAIVNKLNIDKIELAKISQVIYMMIDTLLVEPTGEPNAVAIRLLFKCLLPKLVAASLDCRNANNLVRASYVTYAAILLSKYAKAAVSGFNVLLQHLCYAVEGLERAEVRQARVSLVVGLMSLLPRRTYSSIVKWLLKLTTTAKISHRHIGMEILAELLSNDPEDPPPPPPTVQQPQPTQEDTPQPEPGPSVTTVPEPTAVQPATESEAPKTTETPAVEMETSTNNETEANTEGDQPLGDLPSTDQTLEELLLADQPPADQTFDDIMTADQPPGDQTAMDQTTDDRTTVNQATEDQPTVDQATDDQTIVDQATDDQTTVEQATVNQPEPDQPMVEPTTEVQAKANNKLAVDQPTAVSTEDESSQEPLTEIDHEPTEEEVAGLLLTRRHTVPHGLVLRAVLARAADASSTLRVRALSILAQCADRPRGTPAARAFQDLNGSGAAGRLVGAAARCAGDERAAVRRAALLLLQRMMRRAESDVTTNNLGVLVSLCRDASILVRSAAITALGELTIQWGRASVTDAFLTGPLHQLSDPETKVQEQLVALIQQILIDRLQKYSPVAGDPLPWTFLAAVTRHNMRRHLQKACALLAKNARCINHKIVDILSTHLGAVSDERDLQCLVMLTSVSRHVDYTELGFLLDYYYKITLDTDQEERDARLLPLSLELLSDWSSFLPDDARSDLRSHLIHALGAASAAADNCRTSCAALAAHLDPVNLQWANELLEIYQRRALSGGPVSEWVCAADMSLVAPQPPDEGLLQLFLSAVETPPIAGSAAARGCTVAGLGRLCARSRDAAAAAAPPLARLLYCAAEPTQARVNALLALTDICTRYTCIVEPLLGCVVSCLARGACTELRRAAATALTRLLLGGYLRLRTPLYYTYCALLADEDHDVREPAEYYVTCCLTADAIYHHFVECVLHYNNEDSESISFDARQLIYDVMLQRMSLVQRLNVQCRLATEILEHAADMCDEGDGELSSSLNAALLDTITLLCGPRMKLPRKPQKDGEADIDDLHERVTTNIVSHKMKRTVAEVLVPAVLRLYARLRTRGGQLNVYLVRIATDLLKDYRQEIEELIENDSELVSRIRMFQENIGSVATFGNTRNLVTASTGAEPDTPHAPRRRQRQPGTSPRRGPPAKRKLRV